MPNHQIDVTAVLVGDQQLLYDVSNTAPKAFLAVPGGFGLLFSHDIGRIAAISITQFLTFLMHLLCLARVFTSYNTTSTPCATIKSLPHGTFHSMPNGE